MNEQQQQVYQRFLKDFEDIINIDSSSEDLDGIYKVAEFLHARMVPLGLNVEISREGKGKVPCLKACTASKNGRYDFMFLAHMDTVFPAGEAYRRPFTIDGNKALGPGVNDTKDGVLLAMYVVEKLKNDGALDDIAICIALNGDEEVGTEDTRSWIEKTAADCDRVLVFEPCRPGYQYVLNRKGGCWIDITAHGVAAHAGAATHLGVNAVVEMAHQIARINELNRPDCGITAQCNVVRGGEKMNIIPDRATLQVDVRFETTAEMEEVVNFFKMLPDKTFVAGATIEVAMTEVRPPLESCPDSEHLLSVLAEEGKALGIDVSGLSTGGCSDGNWTAAMGIPTLDGMGPVGDNSHRKDEYMLLDSIIPCMTMVAEMCKRVVRRS